MLGSTNFWLGVGSGLGVYFLWKKYSMRNQSSAS